MVLLEPAARRTDIEKRPSTGPMSAQVPVHPRLPSGRTRAGAAELMVVERAVELIEELGRQLDRQLNAESRASERMRMLRETTNRITRAANDAISAYAKAQRSLAADLAKTDRNATAAIAMRDRLRAARLELLKALEVASDRYPWTEQADQESPTGEA